MILKKKVFWYIAAATVIFIGAVVIRFYQLPQRVIFTEDHALFNIFAYKNIIYHERLVTGPSIGGVWATFPPTFYIITTWLLKVTNFNYYVLHILTAVCNLAAIILMAVFLPKIFGKTAALITIFLYSFSFFVVSQAIVGTNPGVLPPLTVLFFLSCVWFFKYHKLWTLPLAAGVLGFMTQFHVTPFFLIPGFMVLFAIYFRNFKTKYLIAVVVAGLVFLYVGIRPHYLENKAFGGQNLRSVEKAIFHGVGNSTVSKPQSIGYFLIGLSDISADLFLPNPTGFQDTTPTQAAMKVLGALLLISAVAYSVVVILKSLKKPTVISVLAILFLSNLFFQTIIPSYDAVDKPFRWLDATYFPLFFLVFGSLLANLLHKLKPTYLKLVILICVSITSIFLVVNINKWSSDAAADGRLKIETIIKKAHVVAPLAANETNINLLHIGNVNMNPTWPFALALWKETGNDKYLRTLLWNIDPKRNEPFYIFSDVGDSSRLQSENLAKSFQDNPKSLSVNLDRGFLVEKIYNQP